MLFAILVLMNFFVFIVRMFVKQTPTFRNESANALPDRLNYCKILFFENKLTLPSLSLFGKREVTTN
jgi:hypothetical protein